MSENDLPNGADWIPDVLPDSLWAKEDALHFGDARQMAMLRIAEVEVGLTWQNLMRSYLFLGLGIHTGGENGEFQFIRRVREDEKPLSLDEEVSLNETEWDKKVDELQDEHEIVFNTVGRTSSALESVAQAHNLTVRQMLERITSIGLRMSYELRYEDNVAYYLKIHTGEVVRINELKLGALSSSS